MVKIIGFILTKNNADLIETAFKKIPNSIDAFFVSDDNSNDNIEKVCIENKVNIYKNLLPNGYGGNIKNALNIAFTKLNADYAVEIHGDGAQFDPIATNYALDMLKEKNVDFVLGSRFKLLNENIKLGYPLSRMIPNLIISSIERIILNLPISDFHQGYRVYSKKMYKKINQYDLSNNYLFSFQCILLAKKENLVISEVPVLCDYISPHTSHKLFGKNSAFTYQIETFKLILKYLLFNKIN